jgi:hypothetical protein
MCCSIEGLGNSRLWGPKSDEDNKRMQSIIKQCCRRVPVPFAHFMDDLFAANRWLACRGQTSGPLMHPAASCLSIASSGKFCSTFSLERLWVHAGAWHAAALAATCTIKLGTPGKRHSYVATHRRTLRIHEHSSTSRRIGGGGLENLVMPFEPWLSFSMASEHRHAAQSFPCLSGNVGM